MWGGGGWVIALLLLPGFSEGPGGGGSFACSDVFHVEDPGYYDLMKSSKGHAYMLVTWGGGAMDEWEDGWDGIGGRN